MDPKRNIKGLKLTLGEKKEKKRNNKKYEKIQLFPQPNFAK